jgi:hypothetical protein
MRNWQFRSAALRVMPAVFGCIALVSVSSVARSQTTTVQYAAKYVCGNVSGKAGTPGYGIVAQGAYFTSVNVHNPNSQAVDFVKIFDIALPSETAGRVAQPVKATLKPQEAFEIECADIIKHIDANPAGFWKGFVTLVSPAELDVVAVYTAEPSAVAGVSTWHTERVPKRP